MPEMIIFSHKDQQFAIKAELVEEILQPQKITITPHTSKIVEGLINIHGKIVLLFNFRRILEHYGSSEKITESNLMEVANVEKQASKPLSNILLIKQNNSFIGLFIEEVIEKTVILEDAITDAKENSGLLFYAGQFLHKQHIIILVSLDILMSHVADENHKPTNKSNQIAFGRTTLLQDTENPQKHVDDINVLIARINTNLFCIELDDIQELIFLSDITPTPFLPPEVLGLVNLRNLPLIVISLSHIIYETTTSTHYPYGIVVKSPNGLIIFAIHDLYKIERFEKDSRHYIKKPDKEIKGWLKQTDNTYKAIIDINAIFNSPLLQQLNGYINENEGAEMSYLSTTTKRYLITKIEDEYCGICLENIKIVVDEINIQQLPVSESSLIENTSNSYIKGVSQVHGEIMYVFDTYKLLNKPTRDYKNYIIITVNNRSFVLPIQNVDMVINVNESDIESLDSSESIINKIAKVDKRLISIIDTSYVLNLLPKVGEIR
ncbi:chemotaxis protein CheW [Candidatus Bodocaedibacter vickermanii]|uniref:Purine-binding chemotaxis protein CheW n=1 Tax=Candidatus Bodocaedibacter vickermanii TaxID=2741701 RepID=A0A7L9RUZ3_9PROT|nr:purine-binding chemotaxis protein CheW [Candidatus Paracaedibacteraceae bacterium 'Lake Konstanz']